GVGRAAARDPRVGAARRPRRRRPPRTARTDCADGLPRPRDPRVPGRRRGRGAHVSRVHGRPGHARSGRQTARRRGAWAAGTPEAALGAGLPVVLPFDTVYGLAAEPHDEESTRRLYELKGRARTQPTALVAASVDALQALLPELDTSRAWHLLPGPLTLVVP